MNSYFFKLCWKNVWRNKRRTLLTVNAIGLGVMALVFLHNYYDTFHQQVIHNVIRYHSGHMAIAAEGFEKNHSANIFLNDAAQVLGKLQNLDTVVAHSPRIVFSGLVSTAHGSSNIAIMGVDPIKEASVTQFAKKISKGSFLGGTKTKSIVLGSNIAANLRADLDSKVVVLTQGVDGSVGNELYRVAGIFETGSDADKSLAFIDINDGRSILSLPPDAAHQVAVVAREETEVTALRDTLKKILVGGLSGEISPEVSKSSAISRAPEIFTWKELQRPVVAMIELDRAVNRLLMFLILGVAAIGIANSILMSIMERTREFGVMLAIGTSRREVISMVVVETMLLTIIGVVVGNLFGILLTGFFNRFGFDLKWLTSNDFAIQGTLVQTVSYPVISFENSLMVTAVIVGLALIVSVFPARHVGNLTPVKALRSL